MSRRTLLFPPISFNLLLNEQHKLLQKRDVTIQLTQCSPPPQRLLLVNTRERNGSGSTGERKRERGERWEEGKGGSLCQIMSQPSRAAGIFFPRRDCRRPLRRRENSMPNCPRHQITGKRPRKHVKSNLIHHIRRTMLFDTFPGHVRIV